MEYKTLKVFLDSNIVFSAAYIKDAKTIASDLFVFQSTKTWKLFISELVEEEVIKNITIKKPENIEYLNLLFSKIKTLPNYFSKINDKDVKELPLNDKIILSTAIYNAMDMFLTGNKRDFLDLYHKKIGNTLILSPSDFINKSFIL